MTRFEYLRRFKACIINLDTDTLFKLSIAREFRPWSCSAFKFEQNKIMQRELTKRSIF